MSHLVAHVIVIVVYYILDIFFESPIQYYCGKVKGEVFSSIFMGF